MENNPFSTNDINTQNAIIPVYENNARRSLYIAVVAFLAGVLVGFGSYRVWPGINGEYAGIRQSDEERVPLFIDEGSLTPQDRGLREDLRVSGGDVIIVNDQPAGNKVTVELVTTNEGGWVAIHEDRNGKPGNILGAQFFSSGAQSGAVDLLRATEGGKIYYAVLRSDDGDRQFDYTKDVPLDGKTLVSFTANANPI